jgi:hypothetical protein
VFNTISAVIGMLVLAWRATLMICTLCTAAVLYTALLRTDATKDVSVKNLSTEAATVVSAATADTSTSAIAATVAAATAAATEASVPVSTTPTATAQQRRTVKYCSIGRAMRSAFYVQQYPAPAFTVGQQQLRTSTGFPTHATVHKAEGGLRVSSSGMPRNPSYVHAADTVAVGPVCGVKRAWGYSGTGCCYFH